MSTGILLVLTVGLAAIGFSGGGEWWRLVICIVVGILTNIIGRRIDEGRDQW